MDDLAQAIKELEAEAVAFHKRNAVKYYDALRRISAICDENEGTATAVIRMLAEQAVSRR